MKDCLGTEINIGDSVLWISTHKRSLSKGEVVRLTPKGVKVVEEKHLNEPAAPSYLAVTQVWPDRIYVLPKNG